MIKRILTWALIAIAAVSAVLASPLIV